MKTRIIAESMVITNRKDIKNFFESAEEAGLKINVSRIARKTGLNVSTVFDTWKRIERDNQVEAVITISPKDTLEGLSVAQEAPFLASKPLKGSIPRLKQQSLKSVRKGSKR